MIGRATDYVYLTSVSMVLQVAVKVIQRIRHNAVHQTARPVPQVRILTLRQSEAVER